MDTLLDFVIINVISGGIASISIVLLIAVGYSTKGKPEYAFWLARSAAASANRGENPSAEFIDHMNAMKRIIRRLARRTIDDFISIPVETKLTFNQIKYAIELEILDRRARIPKAEWKTVLDPYIDAIPIASDDRPLTIDACRKFLLDQYDKVHSQCKSLASKNDRTPGIRRLASSLPAIGTLVSAPVFSAILAHILGI